MSLQRLEITRFRNIQFMALEPCSEFNLIYGENGSGKTSILEAIYYLGLGRSFRSHSIAPLIQEGESRFILFGLVNKDDPIPIPVGIEKSREGKSHIKVMGEHLQSITQLTELLPLQLINPDSYLLLNAGPKLRRRFIDWGVFHVEHSFISKWRWMQRALEQRNAALRETNVRQHIEAWNMEFVQAAEDVNSQRKQYLDKLLPLTQDLIKRLLGDFSIQMIYQAGWNQEQALAEVLSNNFYRDKALGYTQYGPQRADIVLTINGLSVDDILSRGQQKLLVYALQLAQGMLLKQLTNKNCIYLIDDLPAELDKNHLQLVIEELIQLKTQVFITSIEKHYLKEMLQHQSIKLFHVEHGDIKLKEYA